MPTKRLSSTIVKLYIDKGKLVVHFWKMINERIRFTTKLTVFQNNCHKKIKGFIFIVKIMGGKCQGVIHCPFLHHFLHIHPFSNDVFDPYDNINSQ